MGWEDGSTHGSERIRIGKQTLALAFAGVPPYRGRDRAFGAYSN